MAKITLTPGMNKRNFEDATGLKVDYRDKRKTGISFKLVDSYCISAMRAHDKKDELLSRFNGCKVNITKKYCRITEELIFVVRVIIPLA